ncbi:MAG: hypothetical protein HKP12_09315 [Gammaproteobacteria bacterium]|nr:hypothetical protein [Gammaproteobacteria bacterium]NNJ97346.1 hypothetical protein [Gammaproteobacteria bacterium]
MTKIVINDLNDSREMDREAMRAVTGGRADSFYRSQKPYSSTLESQYDPRQDPFSWATAGITDQAR